MVRAATELAETAALRRTGWNPPPGSPAKAGTPAGSPGSANQLDGASPTSFVTEPGHAGSSEGKAADPRAMGSHAEEASPVPEPPRGRSRSVVAEEDDRQRRPRSRSTADLRIAVAATASGAALLHRRSLADASSPPVASAVHRAALQAPSAVGGWSSHSPPLRSKAYTADEPASGRPMPWETVIHEAGVTRSRDAASLRGDGEHSGRNSRRRSAAHRDSEAVETLASLAGEESPEQPSLPLKFRTPSDVSQGSVSAASRRRRSSAPPPRSHLLAVLHAHGGSTSPLRDEGSDSIVDDVATLYQSIQSLSEALMSRSMELASMQSAVAHAQAESSRAASLTAGLMQELVAAQEAHASAVRSVEELQQRLTDESRRFADLVEATTADSTAQIEHALAQASELSVALAGAQEREVVLSKELLSIRALNESHVKDIATLQESVAQQTRAAEAAALALADALSSAQERGATSTGTVVSADAEAVSNGGQATAAIADSDAIGSTTGDTVAVVGTAAAERSSDEVSSQREHSPVLKLNSPVSDSVPSVAPTISYGDPSASKSLVPPAATSVPATSTPQIIPANVLSSLSGHELTLALARNAAAALAGGGFRSSGRSSELASPAGFRAGSAYRQHVPQTSYSPNRASGGLQGFLTGKALQNSEAKS